MQFRTRTDSDFEKLQKFRAWMERINSIYLDDVTEMDKGYKRVINKQFIK